MILRTLGAEVELEPVIITTDILEGLSRLQVAQRHLVSNELLTEKELMFMYVYFIMGYYGSIMGLLLSHSSRTTRL